MNKPRECPICAETDPSVFIEGEYVDIGVGMKKISPDVCQRCGYEDVGSYANPDIVKSRVAHNDECRRQWEANNKGKS